MNSHLKKIVFIFVLSGLVFFSNAQNAQAKCPCTEEYNQQDQYWFLDDEGGDQNAVSGWSNPDTAINTNITGVAKETLFRLRMAAYEASLNDQDPTFQMQLEYSSNATSCTSGDWTKVTDVSSDVQYSTSSNFTSPVASTERFTSEPQSKPVFVAGEIVDDRNPTKDLGTLSDQESESEWALIFTSGVSDGATYRFRVTDAGSTANWTWPADCPHATTAEATISVGGFAYSGEGSGPLTTKTVSISINGQAAAGSDTTDGTTGEYSITGLSPSAGDVLTLYLDDDAEDAVTVTVADGNAMTNIDLYQNRLITRHDNAGSLTNANLATADNNNDAGITGTYTMSSNELTVVSGKELFIPTSHIFVPGDKVATDDIDINGTFTMGANIVEVLGTWDATGGTFTSSGPVILTASTSETLTSNTNSFNDLHINDGLMLHWKMDTGTGLSVFDASGYGHTGTRTDTATGNGDGNLPPPWYNTSLPTVNFANDYGLDFDGTDDQVPAANSDELILNGDITIATWVYRDGTGALHTIMDHEDGTENEVGNHLYEFWMATNSTIVLEWEHSTGVNDIVTSSSALSTTSGAWVHVAVTRNVSTNEVKFYEDGSQLGTTQTYTNDPTGGSNGSLTVGTSGNLSGPFDGKMDDLRIYDRVLSSGEISNLGSGDEPAINLGTITLGDALDINGDLTLSTGILDVSTGNCASSSCAITLVGDWKNDGGLFNEQSGTVTLDGVDQSIPSSETFYQLTKVEGVDNTTDEALTFGERSTTTITDTWTLDGRDEGDRINLVSSNPGTQWKVTPSGTRTIDYTDVTDSNNLSSEIDASGANNNGISNNTNWCFSSCGVSLTLTQDDFEWFVTADSVSLTNLWPPGSGANLDEIEVFTQLPASNEALVSGDQIRIQINIKVTGDTLSASTQAFQLEYDADEDCTTASGWTVVGDKGSGSIWRLFDESSIGDSTPQNNDISTSTTSAEGYYSEINASAVNPNEVLDGEYSEWDWPVENNGAAENTTYCFRIAKSGGAALGGYEIDGYPKLTTAPGNSSLMRHGNFFQNLSEKGFFWAN